MKSPTKQIATALVAIAEAQVGINEAAALFTIARNANGMSYAILGEHVRTKPAQLKGRLRVLRKKGLVRTEYTNTGMPMAKLTPVGISVVAAALQSSRK